MIKPWGIDAAYDVAPFEEAWFDDFGDTDGVTKCIPTKEWKDIMEKAHAGQAIGPLSSDEMEEYASAVNSAVAGSIVLGPKGKCYLGMDQTVETEVPPTAIESQVGIKFDGDKPRYDLEQILATEEVMKVLTYGAKKYSADNWRLVPDFEKRYYSAARRHIAAYMRGELIDPESGLSHLAHAITCLNYILEIQLEGGSK